MATAQPVIDIEKARKALKGLQVSLALFLSLTVIFSFVQPLDPVSHNPGGINMTIVGLELARTPQELFGIIGYQGSPQGDLYRKQFTNGTWLDIIAYIPAYIATYFFLGLMLYHIGRIRKNILVLLVVSLILTMLCDMAENRQIMLLLSEMSETEMLPHLRRLDLFAHSKFIFLGLAGALLAAGLWADGRRGPAFMLAGTLAFSAAGIYERRAVEISALLMAVSWALIFVKILPLKNRWWG